MASLLDFDEIPTYSKDNKKKYEFSGKRVHRGLYKSKDGIFINADVNGAGNTIHRDLMPLKVSICPICIKQLRL